MTVIATSAAATATAYGNQRKVDRCQNGVLWAMFWDGTSTTTTSMDFYYSTDNGGTWTKGGEFGFAGGGATYVPNGSFFIDLDDYAHVTYKDRHDGLVKYRRGTPNAGRTSWTWSAASTVFASTLLDVPDLVAHRSGTGWTVHVVGSIGSSGSDRPWYIPITVTSGGAVTVGTGEALSSGAYGNSLHKYPSIDFHHTGDGKTVAAGAPHLFVGWLAGATGAGKGVRFKKATHSGGSWTWGAEREIDSTRYASAATLWLNCLFDGTRVTLPGVLIGSTLDHVLYERDVSDTTTTTRVLEAGAGNATFLASGSATYDGAGSSYFFGRFNDGADRTGYRKWDRATTSLGSVVTVDSSGANLPAVSAKRGHSNSRIEFVYTDGTGSPYSVTYGSIVLNTAPNAPILTAPADGGRVDRASTNRFDWDFSDPDAGDSQSAYNLRYRVVGAGSWTETGWVATPNTYHDLASGTFTDATDYEWQVATKDAQGVVGPFSASSFFTAATAPASPTIIAPINGADVSQSELVEWSIPEQDAYQLRVLDGTTPVYDTGTVESSTARALTVAYPDNNTTRITQVRVRDNGLWSAYAQVTNTVSWTPPPTPSFSLLADDEAGSLVVSITNPAPTGDEPPVSYNDVHIDDGDGEERRATMVPPNSSWTYWTPKSGRDYDGAIRVVAVGDNQTTASS